MASEAQGIPIILDRLERDGAKRKHLLEIMDAMQSHHCEDSVRVARLFFGKAASEKITLAEFSDALEAMTQRLWGIKALLHGFDEDLNGNPLFDGAHQLIVDVAREMERIAEAFASEIAVQQPREAGLSMNGDKAEADAPTAEAISTYELARDHIDGWEGAADAPAELADATPQALKTPAQTPCAKTLPVRDEAAPSA